MNDAFGWLCYDERGYAIGMNCVRGARSEAIREVLRVAGVQKVGDLPIGRVIAIANLVNTFQFSGRTAELIRASNAVPNELSRARNVATATAPHEADFGDFTAGRYGFVLDGVRVLESPIEVRGSLGLWDLPADVDARLSDALIALGVGA